ncbi:MAG TPA: tryptophan--tRNA ligase [Clostridiales bacterium]|nr:tryptophan--tRNA ligase [Clostridiales bacterium]
MDGNIQVTEKKQVVLSLVQPTGTPTLGNYLGAFKNWAKMAEDYDCLFGAADLHSITVRTEPKVLKSRIIEIYAILLSLGLNPEKNIIFVQSQVPQHSQLGWILNCYTQFGEAARMTQFKDKSKKYAENVNVGLFSYPTLMAADILLYQADFVPVGEDQKQHLELARDIATRMNNLYGNLFTVPAPFIGKAGAKVMSLQEPTKKMSKTDPNTKSFISMLDTPDVILKKIKSAVTDSEGKVYYSEEKPGISNLMSIYSACTGLSYEEIEKEFDGKGYGDFKAAVAEAVIEELRPFRAEFDRIINDKAYILSSMEKGAERAEKRARRTLDKVMKKIGFVSYR